MEDDLTDETPVKDAIKYVANCLENEWREAGRHLGLSEADIQHIKSDYCGNSKEINYQILMKWKKMKGNGATVSTLVEALQLLNRNDIADKLKEGKHRNKKQVDPKDVKEHKKAKNRLKYQNKEHVNSKGGKEHKKVIKQLKVHHNEEQVDPKTVKEHKKVRNQLKHHNKENVDSEDVKEHKKTRDAEPQKSNKIFGPVSNFCLVSAAVVCISITYNVRPNIVMQMINGTLSLLEGARKVEESWQKLSAGSGQHNLVMGKRDSGDQLLYEEKIRKGHSLLPIFYQTHTFTYNCQPNEYITCVVVEDGWDDDTGGDHELVKGGPGKHYVEIKVTSMIGRGMDFSFYVYGRK